MELIAAVLLILTLLFGEIRLYQKKALMGLSYRCGFSKTEVTQGDQIEFTEIVENAKVLPIPWLKTELTVPVALNFPETHCTISDKERFVTGFFSLRGNAKTTRVWQVNCEKRGIYRVEHVTLVTTDLLGAVRLSLPATDTGKQITVLPKRFTSAGLLLPQLLQMQFGENPTQNSLRSDPCLPIGVREYATGDPLNRIHWKTSAHKQMLLVRQEEHTAQQTITVLLALETNAADSGTFTNDPVHMEHTISVCAQCLWELYQNGWLVRLCIGEADAQHIPYQTPYRDGNSAYHSALELLALLPLQHILPTAQLLQMEKNHIRQDTILLITPYTDKQIAHWKKQTAAKVLVTGHAHDFGNCADKVIPRFVPKKDHSPT